MKITDYSILFMMVIFSFFVVYMLEDKILFESIICNEEINRIVDNTVVDALDKGYKGNGAVNEKIDADVVVDSFLKDMCYMLYGVDSKLNRDKVSNNILCFMIINEDGYYLYEKGKMSDKIYFSGSLHEKRVDEIEKIIQDRMQRFNCRILLPKNSGEHNSQTVTENSLIVIYRTSQLFFQRKSYAECIISGAAIK